MSRAPHSEVSKLRRLAAFAPLAGTAAIFAKAGIHSYGVDWPVVAFAGMLGVASVGITRRSLPVQVLSRGAAWTVLFPALLIVLFSALRGSAPPAEVTGALLGTGASLLLARPMLHTREAHAAFNPRVFRRWFLAGSVSTAATAIVVGAVALGSHGIGVVLLGILSLLLMASAVGVVKMRGWAIVLSGFLCAVLASVAFASALFGGIEMASVGVLALPTFLMQLLPVLIGRHKSSPESGSVPKTRIATTDDLEEVPFVRVATGASIPLTTEESPPTHAALRA